MKARGRGLRALVTESFGNGGISRSPCSRWGLTAGQAVVWYTGQFYALFFLTQQLQVDATAAQLMLAVALLWAPRSSLCSRIVRPGAASRSFCWAAHWQRPPIPGLQEALSVAANLALAAAARSQVVLLADPAACSFPSSIPPARRGSPVRCDTAKQVLAVHSVPM